MIFAIYVGKETPGEMRISSFCKLIFCKFIDLKVKMTFNLQNTNIQESIDVKLNCLEDTLIIINRKKPQNIPTKITIDNLPLTCPKSRINPPQMM